MPGGVWPVHPLEALPAVNRVCILPRMRLNSASALGPFMAGASARCGQVMLASPSFLSVVSRERPSFLPLTKRDPRRSDDRPDHSRCSSRSDTTASTATAAGRDESRRQGGPLSPSLSTIALDAFDRELARRGLRFVRYADDACRCVCGRVVRVRPRKCFRSADGGSNRANAPKPSVNSLKGERTV